MLTLRSFKQTWLASHHSIQVLYFLFYVKLLYLEVCQLICCLPQDFILGNKCVNIHVFDLHTKVVVLLIEPKYNWQVFLFDNSLLAVSKRFL